MYYPHFGLKEAPFKITPNTDFFFEGGKRGEILDALIYAIEEGEGIVKVVGEVGSGKTMICRMLQTTLHEDIESIYLAIPSVEPEHVLHAIAFELQLKIARNADRLKVMQRLQDYLLKRHAKGLQTVIFVEEAQAMPIATLEEIRLLSNLETNQDKLLQIVLFGQPELDTNLNESGIRQLRDRITHSFTLGPLDSIDIGEYLNFRLRAAGHYGKPLFSPKSIKKITQASDGLIRRVNILADKSLLSAFSEDVSEVKTKHVNAAIKDSEFANKPADYKLFFLIALALIVGLIAALIFMSMKINNNLAKSEQIASGQINTPLQATEITPDNSQSAHQLPPATAPLANTVIEPKQSGLNETATENITELEALNIDAKIAQSKAALLALPHDTLTIQIMTSINDNQLIKELKKLSPNLNIADMYFYSNKNSPSQRTIILYGHFSDKTTANQAIKALPQALRKKRPFLRSVGRVVNEIK